MLLGLQCIRSTSHGGRLDRGWANVEYQLHLLVMFLLNFDVKYVASLEARSTLVWLFLGVLLSSHIVHCTGGSLGWWWSGVVVPSSPKAPERRMYLSLGIIIGRTVLGDEIKLIRVKYKLCGTMNFNVEFRLFSIDMAIGVARRWVLVFEPRRPGFCLGT